VFNSNIIGAELHIEKIKKADGEIGIKYGDNDYFALINIGDTSNFLKLCEVNKLHYTVNEFDETEFEKINKSNSSTTTSSLISTNVLSNTTVFSIDHVSLSYSV